MARTHVSTIAVTLTSALLASIAYSPSLFATPATPPAVVSGQGLLPDKPSVPDDPLAGLPSDGDNQRSPNRPGKKHSAGKGLCSINVGPASDRESGDVRAAVAFARKGPAAWACSRAGQSEVRLRISIDSEGKITAADAVAGDPTVADAIAQKLSGKAVDPRPAGPTVGVVVLKFTSGR